VESDIQARSDPKPKVAPAPQPIPQLTVAPRPEPKPETAPAYAYAPKLYEQKAMKGANVGIVGGSDGTVFDVGFAYFHPLSQNLSVVSEANFRGFFVNSIDDDVTISGASVPALLQISTNNRRKFMVYAEGGGSADLLFAKIPSFPDKDKTVTVFNFGLPVGCGMAFRSEQTRVDINVGGSFGTVYKSFGAGLRVLPW
jgi:hypothetical protein